MGLNGKTVGERSAAFEEQLRLVQLPRTLMGGTEAMRKAGVQYLPKKEGESQTDYEVRRNSAVLVNKFKETVEYLSGQVFQKPVRYQSMPEGETLSYNQDFFDLFAEDVDTRNTNLSMFAENVFWDGAVDGVCFILADYSKIKVVRQDDGALYYEDQTGMLKPKTAGVDRDLNLRPYLIAIKAEQVLDAWLDVQNGTAAVKVFRYLEADERAEENGERTAFNRVRVFYPDRWEVWEQPDTKSEYVMVDEGENLLGVVPVAWFMPGSALTGLTARPALEDLAFMNVDHWQARSDHKTLMEYVRRPVWKGIGIKDNEGKPLPMGPGVLIDGEEGSDLRSVGVDSGSVDKSFQDLQDIEDSMKSYGLQMTLPRTGNVTATASGIAAAASDSRLKRWVQKLVDCMENALRYVALWENQTDGPALSINTEFRAQYDAAIIAMLSAMVDKGQLSNGILLETMKLMGVFADEFDTEKEVEAITREQAEKIKRDAQEIYTPSLGGYRDEGEKNNLPG